MNRRNWDERVGLHAASPDYALSRFREDPSFISDVVRFDVPRLGDIRGKRGVHLQCHIGTGHGFVGQAGRADDGAGLLAARCGRRPHARA